MVKRSLLGVALLLSLVVGALVTAPSAAASITACGPETAAVNNSHGRFMVQTCVRHTAGAYYSWAAYWCYASGTYDPQFCNIAATQHLWYNATLVRSDDVSGLGRDNGMWTFSFSGSPAGCTSAWIHSQLSNLQVRFNDGYLWSSSSEPKSNATAGSRSC